MKSRVISTVTILNVLSKVKSTVDENSLAKSAVN